jgi:hypothetical protein
VASARRAIYSLITTAKLNDVDPRAWLTYVLARIGDPPAFRLDELLPWNWSKGRAQPTSTKQNGLRRIDTSEHGNRRYHTRPETENGHVKSTGAPR